MLFTNKENFLVLVKVFDFGLDLVLDSQLTAFSIAFFENIVFHRITKPVSWRTWARKES